MDEILTREEMEQRFPNEWVMIENPVLDRHNEVVRGRVIAHHPDHLTAYQALFQSKAKRCASLFMGPVVPEGVQVVI